MTYSHIPVLPNEVLEYLAPAAIGFPAEGSGCFMVQGNMGEGGHAELFLEKFPGLHVLGIDADGAILNVARERLQGFGDRVGYYEGWSNDWFKGGAPEGAPNLILFDLGISSFHYEKSGRGFSFKTEDEPLDMRIDINGKVSAADLIARLGESELANLLYQYGEERYSRRIARAIIDERKRGAIMTSGALAKIIEGAVPPAYRHGRIHPATRSFQALRIAVNGELDSLEGLLQSALAKLAPGGRMGVISFHSLEDRIVKNLFKTVSMPIDKERNSLNNLGDYKIITKKPVVPGDAERLANSASRSAKFRVVEKLHA
ncbi:MAG: 16S rRNA (cytosine(1402)-N(4))-methyltransferase RsmH [Spirochaetaceae bacterium]|jgi:16S rRNA (cytosine1402-N4)-methyltransferase|nr:16S rRNA (cytosine(1402)-N(4))-methyltransferase RsmH [Spirochaetaceae bacterium]